MGAYFNDSDPLVARTPYFDFQINSGVTRARDQNANIQEGQISSKISARWSFRLIFFMLLSTMFASAAYAGRYELEKGKGLEVCEAYERNLNLSKPQTPRTCQRDIHSELGFTRPDWQRFFGPVSRIPSSSHVNEHIDRFLWERDANPAGYSILSQWKGTKRQRRQAWENYNAERNRGLWPNHRLYAEIDIDNNGETEPVYYEHDCAGSYGSLLLVLMEDYSDINYKKTALVMPHPSRKEAGWGDIRKLRPG
ncbi:MAG: hypothetical protein HY308_08610 [Gammaproteobacteria bacterium]|nr:hypothetical protein [Gammaproteobacteria bacterium]